jgi:hypothetical protein
LVIVHHFGIREFSPTRVADLFELICDRHQAGWMIVASSRTAQDWYGLFPHSVLAEGALDRPVNRAHHVLMPGRSYRPPAARIGGRPSAALGPRHLEQPTHLSYARRQPGPR